MGKVEAPYLKIVTNGNGSQPRIGPPMRIPASLRTPVIFDGRNIYEPAAVEAAGIAYYGIGRGRSVQRTPH